VSLGSCEGGAIAARSSDVVLGGFRSVEVRGALHQHGRWFGRCALQPIDVYEFEHVLERLLTLRSAACCQREALTANQNSSHSQFAE
jgi:hypothetical protein